MTKMCRLSIAGVLMMCLSASHWSVALAAGAMPESSKESVTSSQSGEKWEAANSSAPFAIPSQFADGSWFSVSSEHEADRPRASALSGARPIFTLDPALSNSFAAGQVYRGRPYRARRDHTGAITAVVVGAVATITGAAILIYANRPECRYREFGSGCGYGTKVVGGAVLAGGVVGLTIGALSWR